MNLNVCNNGDKFYFELSFDNFQGDIKSIDIYVKHKDLIRFFNVRENHKFDFITVDYYVRYFFKLYRPYDEFIALISLVPSADVISFTNNVHDLRHLPKFLY